MCSTLLWLRYPSHKPTSQRSLAPRRAALHSHIFNPFWKAECDLLGPFAKSGPGQEAGTGGATVPLGSLASCCGGYKERSKGCLKTK
jgi:hypothetical protein